jgi:hypothetical protein
VETRAASFAQRAEASEDHWTGGPALGGAARHRRFGVERRARGVRRPRHGAARKWLGWALYRIAARVNPEILD